MDITFIASEYNPFHNGHKYQIDEVRKKGAEAVVAVMSGNFVQRGDIAVAEKHTRAKAALLSGVDLVIELPIKFAVSNASLFAEGFIKTSVLTGLKGSYTFGATSEKEKLIEIKNFIMQKETGKICEAYSNTHGVNYPAALKIFIEENLGKEYAEISQEPNNILAIEYIKSIDRFCPDAKINIIKRKMTAHDELVPKGSFASACFLRELIYNEYNSENKIYSQYNLSDFQPENVAELFLNEYKKGSFPSDRNKFDIAAMSRLYTLSPEYFSGINNVCGGLENRIVSALCEASDLENLYDVIKTKRYTHSRIRQIILNAVLGIKKADVLSDIPYIRVLGFNNRGKELLRQMKTSSSVPVLMNISGADKNNPAAMRDSTLDINAGKLFNLCLPEPLKGNPEYDIPPVKL